VSDDQSDEGHVRLVPLLPGERERVAWNQARAIEDVTTVDWQMASVEQMLRAALFKRDVTFGRVIE
jgi:hypothetical protein